MTFQNNMKWLVCFDIDGTLLWSGGAGVAALNAAFLEVLGVEEGMEGVACDGMTDWAIVRQVLEPRGLYSATNRQRVLDSYIAHLGTLIQTFPGYRILPGVVETLENLSRRDDCICGLATGNVEDGARIKLERGGLNHYFGFGGFGSDAEERAEVVRCACKRGKAKVAGAQVRSVVIGDTPRDIAAAHAADVLAIGVASGKYSMKTLQTAGADWVIPDLCHPARWLEQMIQEQSLPSAANLETS